MENEIKKMRCEMGKIMVLAQTNMLLLRALDEKLKFCK